MPLIPSMIDLRSDTVTRPTPAMRQAMAQAEVGDDVLDGDPTVARLQARVARMLGKESGLFFPTGSMANMTGVAVHSAPGTEALLDADAHIIQGEMAGVAAICGVQIRPVQPSAGRRVMGADDLRRAIRPPSKHDPAFSVVCVENTHNGAGGVITSLADLRAIRTVADEHHLPVHMDGARLWNAAAASGTTLAEFGSTVHTVMLSFSKGLGCPVGAILVGDEATMRRAHAIRKRLGGGMRQSGVLAAAALYALDAHLDRLSIDHAHARLFAGIVDGIGGARVVLPDSNIVMIDLPETMTSAQLVAKVRDGGVLITEWHASRVRAVAHLDVDTGTVTRGAEVVREALAALSSRAPTPAS